MQNIDTLIHADWIIPVDSQNSTLRNHALAVSDGRILEILPSDAASKKYSADDIHRLMNHVLIPGLINVHTHAAMSLFRGLADDLPLMSWLQDHIWPAEGRWVDSEFIQDGTLLAVAEMLQSGTTCFNDMYFYPDVTARIADTVGIRASVGLIVLDFPTVWANDANEYIHKGIEVHDHYRNNSLISTAFAPHAPYTVSDAPLARVVTLAEELDIPIHMHVHETDFEIQESIKQHHKRPLQRLKELGITSPRLIAVHMTQVNNDDLQILTESGCSIAHCPESNLKLASGFCPVNQLIEAGINVALGTDGAASNNDLDMIGEMRTAALLAKSVANDASALPAHQALRMATINAATALGLDKIIGSLESGKSADIVALDMHHLATQPLYHPISQLVYAANRHQVSDVWVAGKHLLHKHELMTIEQEDIISRAKNWSARIKKSDENNQVTD